MKKYFGIALLLLAMAGSKSSAQVVAWIDPVSICPGDSALLFVNTYGGVPPYSYVWSTGASTQSITVWPAVTTTYYVTVWDSSPWSYPITGTVTVENTPGMPAFIIGNYFPCPGNTEIYTVTNSPGITYIWSVPSGWTILSGQGTNSVSVIVGTSSGTIQVVASNMCGASPARTAVVDPNCGANIMAKTGVVYYDLDQDGSRDPGEDPVPDRIIQEDPGPFFFMSDDSGVYKAYYNSGTYDLSLPVFNSFCTANPALHTLTGTSDTLNDFGITCGNYPDVGVYLNGMISLTNPMDVLLLLVMNTGTTIVSGSVWLAYDTAEAVISTDPVFDYHSNDTLSWNYSNLLPGESRVFTVHFDLPTIAEIGDTMVHNAWVLPVVGDSVPQNNFSNNYPVVVGSYDPNSKDVSRTALSMQEVAASTDLYYTIHFQNTGNATATNVVLRDTLDNSLLQVPSLEFITSSHPCVYTLEPNGTAVWTFNNIMLPDSAADFDGSMGFVAFRIKPKSNLNVGDSILNRAAIYFDSNPPVITADAVTVIQSIIIGTPELHDNSAILNVSPNPANQSLNITFSGPATNSLLLSVVDLSGQLVYSEKLAGQTGTYSGTLDVSAFPEGIYVVKLVSDQATVLRKIVVIR